MSAAKQGVPANQSVMRAFALLEALAAAGTPCRLQDLARATALNPSTALRFLSTLQDLGYVEQDEGRRYFLTCRLCALAAKVPDGADLRELCLPRLRQLAGQLGESACLAIERDRAVVYVAVAEGPDQMVKSMQRIGNVAPIHCTGIGKLFLLNYSEGELDDLIAAKGLPRFTAHTITNKQALLAELAAIRRRGYALDDEECEIGARCVALPVRDFTGKIAAGFSVTGPSGRITDRFISTHLPALTQTAAALSEKLGWTGPEKEGGISPV